MRTELEKFAFILSVLTKSVEKFEAVQTKVQAVETMVQGVEKLNTDTHRHVDSLDNRIVSLDKSVEGLKCEVDTHTTVEKGFQDLVDVKVKKMTDAQRDLDEARRNRLQKLYQI